MAEQGARALQRLCAFQLCSGAAPALSVDHSGFMRVSRGVVSTSSKPPSRLFSVLATAPRRTRSAASSVAPSRPKSASDWAAPHHLERELPPAFLRSLGFGVYAQGDAVWTDQARAALCEKVADCVDVKRGSLVLAGLEDTVEAEGAWSHDVDCLLKAVPARLRFTSSHAPGPLLELRIVLAWSDGGSIQGAHKFSLQMDDWRLLGYGSRLEWLGDAERSRLCRALTLRLETRHGVPAFATHPSDVLVWPTPEHWCALPHLGTDLPSVDERIPRTAGSAWRTPPAHAPAVPKRSPAPARETEAGAAAASAAASLTAAGCRTRLQRGACPSSQPVSKPAPLPSSTHCGAGRPLPPAEGAR